MGAGGKANPILMRVTYYNQIFLLATKIIIQNKGQQTPSPQVKIGQPPIFVNQVYCTCLCNSFTYHRLCHLGQVDQSPQIRYSSQSLSHLLSVLIHRKSLLSFGLEYYPSQKYLHLYNNVIIFIFLQYINNFCTVIFIFTNLSDNRRVQI